ncbi:uncharacterized protein NPIL_341181 [Nephila pilipes]|uniref:Uncharacterized protein n=1 Tax=Nephila pilipes TaxID=299642 RepID=A0A8X6QHT4_NEPPI|nr:uncharacterized protein NPIL_341181 [Nephila pilipes]
MAQCKRIRKFPLCQYIKASSIASIPHKIFTREIQSSYSSCLIIKASVMSSKRCTLFILFCVLLSSVLLIEAGTIHSSLGTGETNRGWKPGGKRGLDCIQLQSEALFTILEVVKDEVQKISNCERIHFDEKAAW